MKNDLPSTLPILPFPAEEGYIELEAAGDFIKAEPHFLHLVLAQQITRQGRPKVQANTFRREQREIYIEPFVPTPLNTYAPIFSRCGLRL